MAISKDRQIGDVLDYSAVQESVQRAKLNYAEVEVVLRARKEVLEDLIRGLENLKLHHKFYERAGDEEALQDLLNGLKEEIEYRREIVLKLEELKLGFEDDIERFLVLENMG